MIPTLDSLHRSEALHAKRFHTIDVVVTRVLLLYPTRFLEAQVDFRSAEAQLDCVWLAFLLTCIIDLTAGYSWIESAIAPYIDSGAISSTCGK
jgi:hypothetical protein